MFGKKEMSVQGGTMWETKKGTKLLGSGCSAIYIYVHGMLAVYFSFSYMYLLFFVRTFASHFSGHVNHVFSGRSSLLHVR